MNIKQWIKDAFTEDDGNAICVAKCLAVLAVFSFIGYAAVGLWHGHFSLSEFGDGLMTVLLGSGGVIAGKQITQK
jgi:hypothetical protein